VLLRRDGHTQLIYKHAISTVMPGAPIMLFDGAAATAAGAEGAGPAPAPAPRRETTLSITPRDTTPASTE
jgi:host factor-I protein